MPPAGRFVARLGDEAQERECLEAQVGRAGARCPYADVTCDCVCRDVAVGDGFAPMRVMGSMTSVDPFDGRTIAQFDHDWEAVFDRGDYQVIAASYTENARLIAAHIETIVGRPHIEAFWRRACEGAAVRHLRRIVHSEQADVGERHATLCGTVSLQLAESTPVLVRFVTVWKRELDGVWRIAVDISTPAPAPPQPPADRGF